MPRLRETIDCDLIVNVQGDEPLIEPAMIDEAVAPFAAEPDLRMSTLRRRIDDPADFRNPNVTKVVVDLDGYALYFSRAPIPYVREDSPAAPAWRHVGLYVYRRECLLLLASLAPTVLEQSEALEQLRALEHGIRIKAIETHYDSIGVDTPDDLERVRRMVGQNAKTGLRAVDRAALTLDRTPTLYQQRLRPESAWGWGPTRINRGATPS